jgi:anti-anti-sigma regulatory factor
VRKADFTYYMHDGPAAFRFQLVGDLCHDATADLDQARQTASSVFGGRSLIVDLTGIESIDTAGRELIEKWHTSGAHFVVTTRQAMARIQSMTTASISLIRHARWRD